MNNKPLLWQIGVSFTFLMIIALVSTGVIVLKSFRDFHLNQVEKKLITEADLIAPKFLNKESLKKSSVLQAQASRLKNQIDADITILDLNGNTLADTRPQLSDSDESVTNPIDWIEPVELREAENILRYSVIGVGDVLYVKSPIQIKSGKTVATLRLSKPLTAIAEEVSTLRQKLFGAGLIVLLLSAGIGWFVAKRIVSPLQRMTEAAKEYSPKSQRVRVPVSGSREISDLAITFNKMVSRLERQFREIVGERNKFEAVLESMVEGVIAVDVDENILSVNRAAEHILGILEDDVAGKNMQKHVNNEAFQNLVRKTLSTLRPQEDEVVLQRASGMTVQANASPLVDPSGQAIGALLVFHDISRLRQLERVRKEFVSNVSHELKTPITSIQGFAETILAGAIENRADTERFLNIISRQAKQLHAIIDDLLTLSRLEHSHSTENLRVERTRIKDVVDNAMEVCQYAATEKGIKFQVNCPSDIFATVSAALLEQALVNLVSNAIRYSSDGKTVSISVTEHNQELLFEVQDQGVGIEAQHLDRLFERFYRADPARSRKVGGTGLGLSIVKHIALAHEGSVNVESTPGIGSTFSIRIPCSRPGAELESQAL